MKSNMSALPKLAAPAQRALASAGVTNLKQLTKLTEAEVAQLHGMGPNALSKLRAALKAQNLTFKQVKTGEARK
jgi:DNA repair protein RadC